MPLHRQPPPASLQLPRPRAERRFLPFASNEVYKLGDDFEWSLLPFSDFPYDAELVAIRTRSSWSGQRVRIAI